MKIGDAARQSGISAKMIRYYEAVGLIRPADRSASNYRDYSSGDVDELRFIRRARDLGFSVAEIAELLEMARDRSRRSSDVSRLARAHTARLRDRIESLEAMVRTLETVAERCAADEGPNCPIIDILSGVETSRERSADSTCAS